MDHYSYLITMPYRLLDFGVICLLVAVISTYTGKALTRGQGLVYRAEDPKTFWWLVAFWSIFGLILIAEFLSEISN